MKARRSSVGWTIATMILVGVMALGFSGPAASQDYPTKAVSMVIGMDPGGVVDVASRVLSEEAKKVLGHEILVENKPGASHMVAGGYVVSSKPDGYVVWGSTDAPFIRVPHMMKLKFDPIKETTPIIFYGIITHFVVVPDDSPFKTLKDMLVFRGQIDLCIVGSDRTASNGDVCNKIGTYLKALAAHDNGIPFYVALPHSTIDWTLANGAQTPIEERDHDEVLTMSGRTAAGSVERISIASPGARAANPAFDVTPARLVTALITEKGVVPSPDRARIAALFE